MSDRQKLITLGSRALRNPRGDLNALKDIVDKTQNQETCDEPIDPDLWLTVRYLYEACRDLQRFGNQLAAYEQPLPQDISDPEVEVVASATGVLYSSTTLVFAADDIVATLKDLDTRGLPYAVGFNRRGHVQAAIDPAELRVCIIAQATDCTSYGVAEEWSADVEALVRAFIRTKLRSSNIVFKTEEPWPHDAKPVQ